MLSRGLGDNGVVPFPAVPLPVSFAIGIPISLAAFAAQEAWLRRRRAHRAPVGHPERPAADAMGVSSAVLVTGSAPRRPAPPAVRRRSADPAPRLRRRHAALASGLDAIIDFVDRSPRRAAAAACAETLAHSIPSSQRGPATKAFLDAVGTTTPPSRLQALAEEAGVEVATAIKALSAEIRALGRG
ncbi:MAG: hypothetical protein NVSMB17_01860 [Candidatus Dormibacteria bacterium]